MTKIYGKIFNDQNLSTSHLKIIELVGEEKVVLEVGASTGYLTKQFSKNKNLVDVVEIDQDDAKIASQFARNTFVGSIEDKEILEKIKEKYDLVVAADVLEHLIGPEVVLDELVKKLKPKGKIIIALPNIASWGIRKDLFLRGKFEYQDTGILDRTHLKFFTYNTVQKFVREAGLNILYIYSGEITYPFKGKVSKVPFLRDKLAKFLEKKFPNLTIVHMIILAQKP